MDWSVFLTRRAARLSRVLAAESGARAALREALAGWGFAVDPALLDAVLGALDAAELAPPPVLFSASLAPNEALPAPPPSQRDLDEPLHRLRLSRLSRPPAEIPDTPAMRRRWALETLAFLGEQVEDRERAAWGREALPPDPTKDAAVAGLWARCLQGGAAVWKDQRAWESLLQPAALGSWRQVISTRELPEGVARRALTDLRDGLWFQFLGGKEGPPGWAELAVRVVETAGGAAALAPLLSESQWRVASGCAVARGTWPQTLARALPEIPGGPARALALGGRLCKDPERVEALLDAHVVFRLLDSWASPDGADPTHSWAVVVQNRGRARSRLRALAMEAPARLGSSLLSLDALHARTLAAMRRYAWDHAWGAMARGFEWDFGAPVTAPCRAPGPGLEPIADGDLPALRTWVLLVLLKGRREHLQRWVETGGTGDRDGTWGRLLGDELPDALRDPPSSEASGGRNLSSYHRLRAWLADGLDEVLAGWRPTLAELVALPATRTLARAMEGVLSARWDGRVPFPKAGFPTFQAHAAAALASSVPTA